MKTLLIFIFILNNYFSPSIIIFSIALVESYDIMGALSNSQILKFYSAVDSGVARSNFSIRIPQCSFCMSYSLLISCPDRENPSLSHLFFRELKILIQRKKSQFNIVPIYLEIDQMEIISIYM